MNGTTLKIKTVAIDGNISVGKSTLLNHLKQLKLAGVYIHVVPEPIHLVSDLLQRFYADKKRWSFTFQIHMFTSRVAHANQEMDNARKLAPVDTREIWLVLERSAHADLVCFVEMLHDSGDLDDVEYNAYKARYEFQQVPQLDLLIHLDVPPEECYRRMQLRARAAEADVSLDYLTALDAKHRAWLVPGGSYRDIPIRRIDGTGTVQVVAQALCELLQV